MMGEPNMILTGMMGAGKSTVGRLLAIQLGKDFVDLDDVIEVRAGTSVKEIFNHYGEAHFRDLEALALGEALARPNVVVATGGGAIVRESNRDLMRKHSVVWLAIDSATAAQRLTFDGTRPLLEQDTSEAMVNWQELEAERRWAYALCDWVVDASLSPEDAAREIGSWWVNTHGSSTKEDRPWQARHLLVAVEGEPYPIHFGHGILGNLGQRCRREIGLKQALVVSNPTVFALYGQLVEESLAVAGVQYETVLIPDGEVHKHLATVESIYAAALDAGMDRRSGIIALGGGVVGDVAGFAAATYMRGIELVQVPTTLLAQVDSSVGGKVGVNHTRGKNLIGAFYQPQLVVADLDTLETLPRRQFLTGMAEVIKYACIYDMALMEELERYGRREVPKAVLAAWLKRSCEIKAQVVAVDAKEMGYREILNFGHTVGHAVEQVAGYGKYTHGEAVAMGMVTATVLSSLKGYLPEHACKRVIQLLREWHLPIDLGMLPLTSIAEACSGDKKARFGELRFVLLHGLGNAQQAEIITPGELLQALEIQQGGFP